MPGAAATLLTGGDVAPTRANGNGLLGAVADRFRAADISFVNLEHSLSTRGAVARGREYFHRGPPSNADGLAEARLSCVNVANNHMLDYGEEALFETLDGLERRAIPFFGAGANLEQASRPCIVEHARLRVGFLGYTTTLPRGFAATASQAGVNPLRMHTAYAPRANLAEYPGVAPAIVTWTAPEDLRRLRSDVAALAARVDVTLVYVHWGASMTPDVHDAQREIGRAAIDAGAQAVFGGHQHVICGVEFHAGCPIVHGSGNLVFDAWEPFFTDEARKTFLLGATLEPGRIRDVHALPVQTGVDAPPVLLSPRVPLWTEIVGDLMTRSVALGTEVSVEDDRVLLRPAGQ